MAQPESRLSRAIMNELRAYGIFAFKVHGGPTMMAGLPDIVACVPVDTSPTLLRRGQMRGLFIGLETKTPSGGDPSPIQERVHDKIRGAYGQVFVVRSVQDAFEAIRSVGWVMPPTPPVVASPDD